MPQLVASALASLLGPERDVKVADRELARALAATGWRDMTRLAGSAWSVWRDTCLTNQPRMFFANPFNRATVAEGGMAVLGEAQVSELPDLGPSRHVSVWPGRRRSKSLKCVPRPGGMIGRIIERRGVIDFRRDGSSLDERLDLRREIERTVGVRARRQQQIGEPW